MGKHDNEWNFYCTKNRAETFRKNTKKIKKIDIKDDDSVIYSIDPKTIQEKRRNKRLNNMSIYGNNIKRIKWFIS